MATASTATEKLSHYVETTRVDESWPRIQCQGCDKSHVLYCPTCLVIHIPKNRWPKAIAEQALRLPFHLDIILDDRRRSSTGVQLMTILKASGANDEHQCRLIDYSMEQTIPEYDDGTYLLFPDAASSRAVSSLTSPERIKRLVVLDCKWNRSSVRLHPNLSKLPKLHLQNPPKESLYWRWHSAGEGMLSTIEAVYYAALEVSPHDDILDMFWLFALQRAVIQRDYQRGKEGLNCPIPFSQAGKDHQRGLRNKAKQAASKKINGN